MRIDKWIWTTWMVKSRTQAGDFCRAGRVSVNGVKVKPAKIVKIGDEVAVEFPGAVKKYRVLRYLEKRGKEEQAAGCFADLNPDFSAEILAYKQGEFNHKQKERKIKFRYGDNKISKKDRREKRKFEEF